MRQATENERMTVAELRERLAGFPDDAVVKLGADYGDYCHHVQAHDVGDIEERATASWDYAGHGARCVLRDGVVPHPQAEVEDWEDVRDAVVIMARGQSHLLDPFEPR